MLSAINLFLIQVHYTLHCHHCQSPEIAQLIARTVFIKCL
jgi:hypothetical protein